MDDSRTRFALQAAAADVLVAEAAAWCLARFANAAPGVTLRAAGVDDAPVLLQMEAAGFPMFDRPWSAQRRLPYECANGTLQGFGYVVKVVACTPSGIGAYMIAQVRDWGELYIWDVASRPVLPGQRIRSAGALMLGVMARLALELRLGRVAAQVARPDLREPIPGYSSARIVAHDTRHGLVPCAQRGILPDGELSHEDAVWLEGRPRDILRILLRKFDGPASSECPEIGEDDDPHAGRSGKSTNNQRKETAPWETPRKTRPWLPDGPASRSSAPRN